MVVHPRQLQNLKPIQTRFIVSGSYLKVDLEILLKGMPDLIEKGTVQQAIQLLPYIPNILIKLGGRGVLSVRLRTQDSIDSDENGTLRLRGGNTDICVRYHPGLKNSGIVSVTGAGYLISLSPRADLVIRSPGFCYPSWRRWSHGQGN
jgi:hypothetical protein